MVLSELVYVQYVIHSLKISRFDDISSVYFTCVLNSGTFPSQIRTQSPCERLIVKVIVISIAPCTWFQLGGTYVMFIIGMEGVFTDLL